MTFHASIILSKGQVDLEKIMLKLLKIKATISYD